VTRIRIYDIDEARRNPTAFKKKLAAGPTRAGFGASYFSALRDALFRYHRRNRDVADVAAYLERRLSRFKSASQRDRYMGHLFWYFEEYEKLGWPTFRIKQTLTIPLDTAKFPDSTCSGEISRLDIIPSGGYAVWFFRKEGDPAWPRHLYPRLVQDSVARTVLHSPPDQVAVGIYAFESREVFSTTYSDSELRAARAELAQLINILGL